MSCKIEKTKLYGKIVCPPNKSYTHRAIMLASLAGGKSIIKNVLRASDTNATIEACKRFGAQIKETGDSLTIKGIKEFKNQNTVIDAKNSGTTIRIAAAIASLSAGKTVLSGDESLRKRPMQPLLDALESIGAKCSSTDGKPPITVSGTVKGGEVNIPGNISSQFVTALMIIAPMTEKGLVLNIKEDLVSKPYLDATINIMEKFSAKVNTITPYKKYQIVPQDYKPTEVTIPTDFSSLALLLSAAVLLGDKVTCEMMKGDLPQGDEKEKEDGLILEAPDTPKGAELNSENDHRLFMAFCIAGMFVGDCTVTNPESVAISYPNFISDMNKVGGKIKSNL